MEKYLMVACLLCSPAAYAEPFKLSIEHQCSNTENIFQQLRKEHREVPIVLGQEYSTTRGEKAIFSIWANERKKTMTVIYTSKSKNVSCIMAAADEVEVLDVQELSSYNK